jgi:hypothetical protein
MMRTLFWCVVTATFTLITCAADAQLVKPKRPSRAGCRMAWEWPA